MARQHLHLADQVLVAAERLGLAAFELGQDVLDTVDGGEDEGHRIAGDGQPVAKAAHQRLGGMGEGFESRQAEKAARSLDGMNEAEDVAQNLFVVGILLEADELDVDDIEMLARFGQKLAQ